MVEVGAMTIVVMTVKWWSDDDNGDNGDSDNDNGNVVFRVITIMTNKSYFIGVPHNRLQHDIILILFYLITKLAQTSIINTFIIFLFI